jgi:hypothetical protein
MHPNKAEGGAARTDIGDGTDPCVRGACLWHKLLDQVAVDEFEGGASSSRIYNPVDQNKADPSTW